MDIAMSSRCYRWLTAFVEIGEIADKLIELKLLIAVGVVLLENRLNLCPICYVGVPQIKCVFDF